MAHHNGLVPLWRAARASATLWRPVVILTLISLLTLQLPLVSAQIPTTVFDPQNFVQNLRTAVEMIREVQLSLQDLAPLTNIGQALNVAQTLHEIVTQVRTIAGHITGRRGLWSAAYPIDSMAALAAFRSSSTQLCRTVSTEALTAQSLITEAADLLSTLSTLVDSIDVLSGSVAGLQSVSANLGALSGQIAGLQTMSAANNEANLCESWAKQIRREAVSALQIKLFSDHGEVNQP